MDLADMFQYKILLRDEKLMKLRFPEKNKFVTAQYKIMNFLPFSSERKRMCIIVERDGKYFVFTKVKQNSKDRGLII